ncbi:molecular chaperone DnaJ [Nocardioides yefusunii]|uniref:Chaperone protein DnaJ n=1 Tax=Nocardioides yefusunii TaxID=2500546 RepID=A0ABW1QVP5_9ACTN|nr:molecular chaperone DnaJ [Nocardioides yefusunii]
MATDGMRADWAQKDFYAVLGVTKDADADAIKKAYRKLARENHPDSNPGDDAKAERFKKVAEAYDVVGDPAKRKSYDDIRNSFASGGFGGFGGGMGGQGGFDMSDIFGGAAGGRGAGSVFSDLFGGGRQRGPRPVKGQDVESTATVSFTDALDGVTISLRLTSDAACHTCNGSGGKPGTKPRVCVTCEGVGHVTDPSGGFGVNRTCPACGGRQLTYEAPCPDCMGSGRGTSARTIQARIPAGVKDGQKIRLKGKGGPGQNGGPAGDLLVTVKVGKHRIFDRSGDNLTVDVPIGFDEAALGAEIKVPTLGGSPVTLKMPAGTPTGRTFRVRGKGVTRKDGTKGDLLATVVVQVPATLDDETRAAVEAYRAAQADRPLRTNLFEEE